MFSFVHFMTLIISLRWKCIQNGCFFFAFLPLLTVNDGVWEREIYIYTPVEYKCWYHSIYSQSLWFKYTKYLILTPTLFDKTNIPYNRFRCVKLAMRVFVSEFTIFSRKTFISPSLDRKKNPITIIMIQWIPNKYAWFHMSLSQHHSYWLSVTQRQDSSFVLFSSSSSLALELWWWSTAVYARNESKRCQVK